MKVEDKKNKHHCWCKWYRDNAGKKGFSVGPDGKREIVIQHPGDCAICGNTGWCY